MALNETAELVATLSLKDAQFTAGAKRASASLKGLQARFQSMGKHVTATAQNLAKLGVGAVAAGTVALKWAADFEEQLNTINTVAGVTPQELAKIGDGIKDLSMETGTATSDLTAAYYDLVSAGVKAADAQDILTQSNKLAIGGLSTTGEAVDLLTTAINVYGLEAKDAERITDGFAQAIAAGKVTASQLAASFADVAPFAKDLGIEIEELQAGYALLTAKGIKASQASTYMKAAIAALINPSADLLKLQAELNVNFAEMAEDRGLVYAYNEMAKAADKAGIPMQKLTGRIEGTAFATNTGGRNFRKYNEELEKVRRASDGAGVAAQQMEERQKGVNASLRRLRETAKVVAITFGEGLLPGAVRGFDAIARKVKASREAIRGLGRNIGDVVEDFFSPRFTQGADQGSMVKVSSPFEKLADTVAGAFDGIRDLPWEEIKGHFTFVSQVAGRALELFRGLPPGLQSAVITLLAANKLTGGGVVAMGGLAAELGKLVLGGLRTITATTVTVIGKTVTGPGTTPNQPGAPGGGGRPGTGAGAGGVLGVAVVSIPKDYIADGVATLRERIAHLDTSTGNKLELGNQFTAAVRDRVQAVSEKAGTLARLQPIQNDLLQGLVDAESRERADFERTGNKLDTLTTEGRKANAVAKLTANASLRALPLIGGVRGAALSTAQAIRNKDLSVRVAVTTNVSATTVAEGVNRVVSGNRVVYS